MLDTLLQTLYLFLPAFIANMCPVLFKWVPFGSKPISKKWFGANKTYRGFYTGCIGALFVLFMQSQFTTPYDLLAYKTISLFLYAAIFGTGALSGDLIKSFFKRRFKISPGRPFVPFDQIDFILGSTLFLLPFYAMPASILFTALLVTPILHSLTNIIGYKLGLKKVWW